MKLEHLPPEERKQRPVFNGFLRFFPDAIAEVAHHSFQSNQRWSPGSTEIVWQKDLSADHLDALSRHLIEYGETRNIGYLVAVAWRAMAALQTEIEKESEND